MNIKNNHILIILVSCIAIFFVNLDALYVNIMEARNFITAREMLHDGHWLLTTLNGEDVARDPAVTSTGNLNRNPKSYELNMAERRGFGHFVIGITPIPASSPLHSLTRPSWPLF